MELSNIQSKICEIRGCKVMLDFDLAGMYGIETKVLKQSVKRNLKKMFSKIITISMKIQGFNLNLSTHHWQSSIRITQN